MSKWRYTIDCKASGQPRAYADHLNVYEVLFEIDMGSTGEFKPSEYMTEEGAMKFLESLNPNHNFTREKNGGWNLSLVKWEKLGPGHFKYVTTRPYTG